jgi:hypothetical protein
MSERQRLSRIRVWLCLFVAGLLVAGITAFPLEWESRILSQWLHGSGAWAGDAFPQIRSWIDQARQGFAVSYRRYPWLAYGTDWLAFGHITIAVAFAGPIRDPVRNKWVVQFGMIACVLVIPLAAICGPLRGIPLFWMPIDMSFGVVGIVPLILAYRHIRVLEASIARSGGDGVLQPSPAADHPGKRAPGARSRRPPGGVAHVPGSDGHH